MIKDIRRIALLEAFPSKGLLNKTLLTRRQISPTLP